MSKQLTFKDDGGNGYDVLAPNGKNIGFLDMLDDGSYYYFCSVSRGGCSSWWMRQVADKLDELNKPWEDHINEMLKP